MSHLKLVEHHNVVELRRDQLRERARTLAPLALARMHIKETLSEVEGDQAATFACIQIIAAIDALVNKSSWRLA
jgi:hypothetical protein